jgi:hypothetical protein
MLRLKTGQLRSNQKTDLLAGNSESTGALQPEGEARFTQRIPHRNRNGDVLREETRFIRASNDNAV